ncbi:hypothetical protein, partial [Vibrio cyclitrophicus]|uniref:hypothetical protein n=1 Tax=Vibrio cyclitrophicus TaxID=47951 RepID=UPI0005165377
MVAEDSGENTGNVLTGTSSPDGDVTVTTFSVGNQTVNAGESITVDGKGTISIDSEGNYTLHASDELQRRVPNGHVHHDRRSGSGWHAIRNVDVGSDGDASQ